MTKMELKQIGPPTAKKPIPVSGQIEPSSGRSQSLCHFKGNSRGAAPKRSEGRKNSREEKFIVDAKTIRKNGFFHGTKN